MSQRYTAGFNEPVLQAQRVFRTLLEAQSHPGRVLEIEPVPVIEPIHPAAMAILLTLVDRDTPLWLDEGARVGHDHLRFHCACPLVVSPQQAQFALITAPAQMPDLTEFALGSDDYPERAATVLIQVEELSAGTGWWLRGPGIPAAQRLRVEGLPPNFRDQLRHNGDLFPRGVDIYLIQGTRLAALPRTTRVEPPCT